MADIEHLSSQGQVVFWRCEAYAMLQGVSRQISLDLGAASQGTSFDARTADDDADDDGFFDAVCESYSLDLLDKERVVPPSQQQRSPTCFQVQTSLEIHGACLEVVASGHACIASLCVNGKCETSWKAGDDWSLLAEIRQLEIFEGGAYDKECSIFRVTDVVGPPNPTTGDDDDEDNVAMWSTAGK
jgi:hypothetical protein